MHVDNVQGGMHIDNVQGGMHIDNVQGGMYINQNQHKSMETDINRMENDINHT